ncbi:MAG: hypothetical protein KDB00_04455 [Planctomycetales bacterium]|nr:hypothetical protein [Planctomycetales bacterium]
MTRQTIALIFVLTVGILTFGTAPKRSSAAEPQEKSSPPTIDNPSGAVIEDGTEPGDDETMSVWMEKKLTHSQAILRGLAMGDFAEVKHNAGRLKVLNRIEGFVRRKNPDYRAHLNTFSRVISEIERQADNENIEGATLAFNQLTVSCVECHKSLRNDESPITEDQSNQNPTAK